MRIVGYLFNSHHGNNSVCIDSWKAAKIDGSVCNQTDVDMTTDQIPWVENLKKPAGDEIREQTVAELRDVVLRGLRGAFLKRGQDEAFCEDVCQESIIKILKNIDSFEGRSKFTTWAISIAIRSGISQLRKRHFKDVSLDAITSNDDMQIEIAVAAESNPGNNIDKEMLLKTLAELIDGELTDKQRTVVRALLGGMPVEEIATRTQSNRNAVYKVFHDAKTRLKRGFESKNFSMADLEGIFA